MMARQGKAGSTRTEDAVEFASVILDPSVSEPLVKKASRPEIIVGSVTIRRRVRRPDRRCRSRFRGSGMIFPANRVRIMVATKPVDFISNPSSVTRKKLRLLDE
ncbi:hypothetical protein [Rhizobium laguerreae]|uniref:hypothetical protein n=1 Tax=Rhizobium laguerreae TaxID=1076926 RepID=UPI001C9192E2|nr:hypothetical protein [Rhizobium laguerreae]